MSYARFCDVCGKRLVDREMEACSYFSLNFKFKDIHMGHFTTWKEADVCPICLIEIMKKVKEGETNE